MGVAQRFDINAVREEKRKAEQARKVKAAISYGILGVVILLLVIAGKFGFDAWKARKDRLAAEARAAEMQEAARLKKERQEREKRRAEETARREAERKAEQKRREDERRRQQEEREEKIRRQQEERRLQEEKRLAERQRAEMQRELKRYADDVLKTVSFKPADYVAIERVIDRDFDFACDDPAWNDLWQAAASRSSLVFFDAIKIKDEVKNPDGVYPTRDTISEKMARLDRMQFTMSVTYADVKKGSTLGAGVYRVDPEEGLVAAGEEAAIMDGNVLKGWRVPFRYGGDKSIFVMTRRKADRLQSEWNARLSELKREAGRGEGAAERFRGLREKYAGEFLAYVRVQIAIREKEVSSERSSDVKKDEPLDKRRQRLQQLRMRRGDASSSRRSSYGNQETRRLGR